MPPSAQFCLYSNFMFMQFQFVKDSLIFLTIYKENSIFFEGHACILRSRKTIADPAEEGADLFLQMYSKKRNSSFVYFLFYAIKKCYA